MKRIIEKIKMLVRDEEGATMVEYGIMVALIAAVSVVIIGTIGQQVEGGFNKVSSSMGQSSPAGTPIGG